MSILNEIIPKVNLFLLNISNGRLGSQLGMQSILQLHTVGRKSGKSFITPLSYYRDGEAYLIVASNWGQENLPNWYLNLKGRSETTIQVRDQVIPVSVREAEGADYYRLWELIARKNSMYLGYQKNVNHRLPIMILTPNFDPR